MLRASPIDVEAFTQNIPVKRAGTPEDMAAACAYLASEEAGYITGRIFAAGCFPPPKRPVC